jgi:hypothetical protein
MYYRPKRDNAIMVQLARMVRAMMGIKIEPPLDAFRYNIPHATLERQRMNELARLRKVREQYNLKAIQKQQAIDEENFRVGFLAIGITLLICCAISESKNIKD